MEKAHTCMEEVKSLDARAGAIPTIHSAHQSDPCDGDGDCDLWCDSGSLCNESDEASNVTSELHREWQRRHNQFHTIGYRDGLMEGKEAYSQEDFNDGFKQSVLAGYKWGIIKGVTSALVCLPNDLKEKLVEMLEKREKIQDLYESVHSVSTEDAFNEFHADIMVSEPKEKYECLDGNSDNASMPFEISSSSLLGRYIREFKSLELGYSAIRMHSASELEIVD